MTVFTDLFSETGRAWLLNEADDETRMAIYNVYAKWLHETARKAATENGFPPMPPWEEMINRA